MSDINREAAGGDDGSQDLSVVFHCTTTGKPRVFCAELKSTPSVPSLAFPEMPSTETEMASAYFTKISSDSFITFNRNGEVNINLGTLTTSLTGCPTGYAISIWNSYPSTGDENLLETDCTIEKLGAVYDPTHQRQYKWTDSPYCTSTKLCSDNGLSIMD